VLDDAILQVELARKPKKYKEAQAGNECKYYYRLGH